MKVILDTNIYISYLLGQPPGRTIFQVVELALHRPDVQLIVPPEVIGELREKISLKPFLRKTISNDQLQEFVSLLQLLAKTPLSLPATTFAESPDPKDDFLLAYGLAEGVDYLVTGDLALVRLAQIEQLKIVKAQTFLEVLQVN